jgi:DNA repair exonuclease SbcCD ATPase subunit
MKNTLPFNHHSAAANMYSEGNPADNYAQHDIMGTPELPPLNGDYSLGPLQQLESQEAFFDSGTDNGSFLTGNQPVYNFASSAQDQPPEDMIAQLEALTANHDKAEKRCTELISQLAESRQDATQQRLNTQNWQNKHAAMKKEHDKLKAANERMKTKQRGDAKRAPAAATTSAAAKKSAATEKELKKENTALVARVAKLCQQVSDIQKRYSADVTKGQQAQQILNRRQVQLNVSHNELIDEKFETVNEKLNTMMARLAQLENADDDTSMLHKRQRHKVPTPSEALLALCTV